MDRDILKLAALITEDVDEYMDLGDVGDEDKFGDEDAWGYPCGDDLQGPEGLWCYGEILVWVNGGQWPAQARVSYNVKVGAHPRLRILDWDVDYFKIDMPSHNFVAVWVRDDPAAGRGELSPEQISDVVEQIDAYFESDQVAREHIRNTAELLAQRRG